MNRVNRPRLLNAPKHGRNWIVALPAALLSWCGLSLMAAHPLEAWHRRTPPVSPTTEDFAGVAYGNGRWVVVGEEGAILSSPDGVQWVAEANPARTAKLSDVSFGNGRFVAVGSGNGVVLTSPDGRQWTQQSPKSGGGLEILHDGTRFVVLAAGGYLSTSVDGVAWEYPPGVPQLYVDVGGIAYGNGVYVAGGYLRTGKPTDLWSCVGLVDWQFRDAKSNQNLFGVGYGLGQFVAVGQKGTVITSPDGTEWTPRTVPHTGFIWDVTAGGSYLAAACQWGRVLTSPDGVEWTRRETGAPDHLTDIAFGHGTFVAVGWNGQIVQSDPVGPSEDDERIVLAQPTRSAGDVQFTFTGTVGQTYQVQATADWASWTTVTTVTCTVSPMNVMLPDQHGLSRFYRIMQPGK
jgi:hypothetical protein